MEAMDTGHQEVPPLTEGELEEERLINEAAIKGQSDLYAQQISPEDYEKQKKTYTKSAVEALMQSEEYLVRTNRCSSCWSLWYYGQSLPHCLECGGYPLQRPCPICEGRCDQVWTRNVDTTHSFQEAHWDGECGLPMEEQRVLMVRHVTDTDEESVLDAMENLST